MRLSSAFPPSYSIHETRKLIICFGVVVLAPSQYHQNSKYYSAVKPSPNALVDAHLPHITIEMPVYKESLDAVL